MPPGDGSVLTVMAGIITALLSVVSYVYRDSLKRADAHIAVMDDRYDELVRNVAATLTHIDGSQQAMLDIVKKMQEIISEQQLETQIQRRIEAQRVKGLTP